MTDVRAGRALAAAPDLTLPDLKWAAATAAGVGHDMRSPLSTLRSVTDLLAEEDIEPEALYAIIRRQLAHLERLADDLGDFGQLLSGVAKVAPERFNLSELVHQVVEDIALVESVPIELQLEEALHAYADPYAVRRILQNLLGNAVKFSTAGTAVTVRASFRLPHHALVQIEDHAGSIHAEDLHRLFMPFERNRTETSGQGLGLFIVRSLAAANSADLWLEPREGGSSFNLLLSETPVGRSAADQDGNQHQEQT